jgi:TonB-dependent SusC/RagA subfamily outer membrane receptor
MNPVSERLLFHKNNDQAQVAFSTDKSFYQKRELVTSEIYVTDTEGEPFAGHLSIAITDDMDIAPDTTHTILSSLLLSSELRGFIESPGYYLQDSREAVFALDHLMMTHGWRRYDLPEALKGNYQHPDIRYEEAKTLTGVVRGGIFSRRIANGVVTYIANDGSFDQTITDADGSFRFDLHYPDSTWFFVQAFNQRGGDGVELVLDNETFPRLQHAAVSSPFSFFGMDKPITDSDFMKKAGQRAQFDENIRMILLDEVIVTARRIDKRDEARLQYWGNLRSDVTIYREDFERRFVTDVTDILRNIPGVRVFIDGGISLRASDTSSFQGDGRPLVLIDGVPIPWEAGRSPLDLAPIFDIETIDILKGASAAIFGIRGANGAISITTRRGGDTFSEPIRPNQVTVTPIGFQQPAEFYSPKYDTPELRNSVMPDFRTTIFWKPDLIASDDGKVTFEFYTSDFSTTYSVVIEGLSDDGRIIRQIETIEVQ